MTKKKQISYSIGLMVLSWILNAIAWTIAGPHPINTIFLIAGVLGFLGGLIWFLVVSISK